MVSGNVRHPETDHLCKMYLSSFMTRFFLIYVTSTTVYSKLNLTIVTIMLNGSMLPFDIRTSGPAIDMGIEEARKTLGPEVEVFHIYRTAGTGCTANNIGGIAADVYYTANISVFIGPGKCIAFLVCPFGNP